MSTVFQWNAEAFSSKPAAYVDQERRAAVRKALDLIKAGKPGQATYVLARSVERQNRIAGGGSVPVPCCPCGGRCVDLKVVGG